MQRKQARTEGEREESDEEESASASEDEDNDDVPYNPKNLPLGWDGKVCFENLVISVCDWQVFSAAHTVLAIQAPRLEYQLQLRNLWQLCIQGAQGIPEALCGEYLTALITRSFFCAFYV